ncbi:glycosyltransferase [Paenibacillus sp. FSL R7-0273]|uniref:tetratricopeptide repeat-containing glycosyltransferase family 2 protein n=1 Tax=Paenibacillus sp. FSL R7-0273 TaxID=1536772 RepID=UPI000970326F|nr:glycosyltransferase [Paenibacillus sp. FSL R7-0273]OMF84391.1 hypothetical protein BK144_30095 [Paenibacillus sp. FSL R7-0273]
MSKLQRKPLISLCMIVKNEAGNLSRCLTSVRGVADELIIVDTGSTDDTVAVARSFGAAIVSFPWTGDFAAARNAGLEQARGTWILVLDADEELDAGSKGELLLCAEHVEYEAFFVRIHNHKGTERSSPVITVNPILRMFRNRPPYRFSGIIHEQVAAAIVEATPAAAMHLSTVSVHHYGYADGVVAKKDKISRNLSLLKEQLKLNPRDAFHQFNTAVEYMRLGDYARALEHIKQSLAEAEPDTSYTHLLYKYEIRCRIMSGDPAGAMDACIRGCALFPDYPDLHHIRGVLLLQAGAFAGAREAFRQALLIGLSPPGYHTESGMGTYLTYAALGQLCQETGETEEAIVCYTRAAQLHPVPSSLLARLVRTMKCAGRGPELAGWLEDHLPQMTADRLRLAGLLLADGCFAAATEAVAGGAEAVESLARGGMEAVSERSGRGAGMASECLGSGEEIVSECLGSGGEIVGGCWASLLQLLLQAGDTPAELLKHQDIMVLLGHPAAGALDYGPPSAAPSVRSGHAWRLLADGALASLTAADDYGPAAARARLMLPLPRLGE